MAHFFSQPLDSRPTGGESVFGIAGRAGLGKRSTITAMMALQPILQPVFDKPSGTLRAIEAVAAGPAQR